MFYETICFLISYIVRMKANVKHRKEVSLDSQTLDILLFKAEKEGRNLKNYMEHILKKSAEEMILSDSYKSNIDNWLKEEEKNSIKFISEKQFLNQLNEL